MGNLVCYLAVQPLDDVAYKLSDLVKGIVLYGTDHQVLCLKENLNAPRLSENPPEEGMSKRLGGIIGCRNKTSSWHLIGLPNGSNIGSTVSYRGETHRDNVHLH